MIYPEELSLLQKFVFSHQELPAVERDKLIIGEIIKYLLSKAHCGGYNKIIISCELKRFFETLLTTPLYKHLLPFCIETDDSLWIGCWRDGSVHTEQNQRNAD